MKTEIEQVLNIMSQNSLEELFNNPPIHKLSNGFVISMTLKSPTCNIKDTDYLKTDVHLYKSMETIGEDEFRIGWTTYLTIESIAEIIDNYSLINL